MEATRSLVEVNELVQLIIVEQMLGVGNLLPIPISVVQVLEELDLDPWLLLVEVVGVLGQPLGEALVDHSLLDLWLDQLFRQHGPSSLDITLEPVGRGEGHFSHYVDLAGAKL